MAEVNRGSRGADLRPRRQRQLLANGGYGAGLFSDKIPFSEFMSMFHGNDERIDQESLGLCTALWEEVAKDLLG